MEWLVLSFAVGFALDWLWCLTVDAVARRRALAAANFGLMTSLCTLLPTYLLVERNVPAVAIYALGGWLGTYISIRKQPCDSPPTSSPPA